MATETCVVSLLWLEKNFIYKIESLNRMILISMGSFSSFCFCFFFSTRWKFSPVQSHQIHIISLQILTIDVKNSLLKIKDTTKLSPDPARPPDPLQLQCILPSPFQYL